LTSDDFVRFGIRIVGSAGDAKSTADGVGGTDWSIISSSIPNTYQKKQGEYSLKEGNALSFALRLKNKKSGTNQTQTPKKAAISKKVSSPAAYPLPFPVCVLAAPYLYLGPFHFFCS
jgi:hypothetical protein